MIIREFVKSDNEEVQAIFTKYWTDPEFLAELSNELEVYVSETPRKTYKFFVAEEDNEILGIVGFRKSPDYLTAFATTNNPAEFYIIATKHQRKGIGEKLKLRLIEEAKIAGYSEILLYSPNSHNQSWAFHDKFGFERVGEITPPDDDPGQLWQKIL